MRSPWNNEKAGLAPSPAITRGPRILAPAATVHIRNAARRAADVRVSLERRDADVSVSPERRDAGLRGV